MSRRGDWMQTYTGVQFWPLDPRPEDLRIEDVSHALAMKCRYNGHCLEFYSVAQHSVLVAKECMRRWPASRDLALWGLLHDLEEAYLPDIPRPLKRMGTGVLGTCANLIMAVAVIRFGLHPDTEPDEVKSADNAVLAAESTQVMSAHPAPWSNPEPAAPFFITPMSPRDAEEHFLLAWKKIDGWEWP